MSEWINVKDRLPKLYSTEVLIAQTLGGGLVNYAVAIRTPDGWEVTECGCKVTATHPTHWKPLTPPEEQT